MGSSGARRPLGEHGAVANGVYRKKKLQREREKETEVQNRNGTRRVREKKRKRRDSILKHEGRERAGEASSKPQQRPEHTQRSGRPQGSD